MAAGHGGARNRSGPPVDPSSGRSDRRGISLTVLPSEGYQGEVPAFPLPEPSSRELDLWASLWRTPQACWWATNEWQWPAVGEMVRLQVRAEDPQCPVNVYERLRQWRADLAMTPAGLKENGFTIAHNELAAKAEEKAAETPARKSSRDRMKVVSGGNGGA